MRGLVVLILVALLLTVASLVVAELAAAADEPPRWSLATSVNYSVGDYGTDRDTTIVYVPVTLGVRPIDRLWLNLTVPYIYQSAENVVVTGGGVATRKRGGSGRLARPESSSSESGLGDVLLRASFVVLDERDVLPEITPWLRVKAPTADEDRGLGTGEWDETLGVDLGKQLVQRLFGYLTLSYTFVGDPPGTDLRDSFGWSVGTAWEVAEPVALFAFLDGSTAIAPGQSDPVELRAGADWILGRVVKLTGAVSRGLTDGAADWGVSGGLTLRF